MNYEFRTGFARTPYYVWTKSTINLSFIISENDFSRLVVHTLHNGETLDTDALLAQRVAAVLIAFLNNGAAADKFGAALLHEFNQSPERIADSEEVIHNQHPVALAEEALAYHYIIGRAVGEGFDGGGIHIARDILRLGFLSKNKRAFKFLSYNGTNRNTARLNRQNFVNALIFI